MATPHRMPDFKAIALEDKHLFDTFLHRFQPEISELTFTNLFVWRFSKEYRFAVIDDHLIIRYKDMQGKEHFLLPVGKHPVKMIRNILAMSPEASFERVDMRIAEELKESTKIEHDKSMSDYVYSIEDLKSLVGEKYAPKRNFIKRFKENSHEVRPLDSSLISQAKNLQERWCKVRDCKIDPSTSAEDVAVYETLCNYDGLDLFGIAVLVEGKLEGFMIGERLNDDTFVDHFEKGDTTILGIYPFLLNEFVKRIDKKFKFINREQDLGIPGLRKSKESWYPVKMIEKYKVSIRY